MTLNTIVWTARCVSLSLSRLLEDNIVDVAIVHASIVELSIVPGFEHALPLLVDLSLVGIVVVKCDVLMISLGQESPCLRADILPMTESLVITEAHGPSRGWQVLAHGIAAPVDSAIVVLVKAVLQVVIGKL